MSHPATTHAETRIDPRGPSNLGIDGRKFGMWLFLATEVMFFSALIGAFLSMKARSPADANHVLNVPVTAINTFVLIISSFAVVMALSAAQDGDRRRTRNWLIAVILLGAAFVGVQVYEYQELILHEGFTPSSSLFGSGFFTVTGLHGTHVFIGLLWAIGLLRQHLAGRVEMDRFANRIEIFGLYWHFVDVVWIVLFTIIYLI